VDNVEESQVTTVEQNTDNMNNFCHENPSFYLIIDFFFQAHKNITCLTAAANISTG